jgi:hypothetical protein
VTSGNASPATTSVRIPHKQPTPAETNRTFLGAARPPSWVPPNKNYGDLLDGAAWERTRPWC